MWIPSKLLLLAVIIIGGVLLQIYLSKMESKWPGLILPTLSFLYSIMMILGLVAYVGNTIWETLAMVLAVFIQGNIPTLLLLAIYFACRKKKKAKAEIDKMNIQDL